MNDTKLDFNDHLHNLLLNNGYKVTGAPDEATIYTHPDGTIVTVTEKDYKGFKQAIKKQGRGHPVTGHVTPAEAADLLFYGTREVKR